MKVQSTNRPLPKHHKTMLEMVKSGGKTVREVAGIIDRSAAGTSMGFKTLAKWGYVVLVKGSKGDAVYEITKKGLQQID